MTHSLTLLETKNALIIPCYCVKNHILDVIGSIGKEITSIYVVDDACPEKTGDFVAEHCTDSRVSVIFHSVNQGVGGAVLSGFRAAVDTGHEVLIKVDGDGQMDPKFIPKMLLCIQQGSADYVKGNRFFDIRSLRGMPFWRLVGNAGLSVLTKISSGYWNIMDPTNGYIAIDARLAAILIDYPVNKRYFFETDMLCNLYLLRAKVLDLPMPARYGDEISNLSIVSALFEFPPKHLKRFLRRLFYTYFMRDFNIASLEMILAMLLIAFGVSYGLFSWGGSILSNNMASSGTVMLSALPIILGAQLLLSVINYDIANVPSEAISKTLIVDYISRKVTQGN